MKLKAILHNTWFQAISTVVFGFGLTFLLMWIGTVIVWLGIVFVVILVIALIVLIKFSLDSDRRRTSPEPKPEQLCYCCKRTPIHNVNRVYITPEGAVEPVCESCWSELVKRGLIK